MFQQVPMVEIDGMKLIQTKAILNYIAEKYHLHGVDLKDRVMYGFFNSATMDPVILSGSLCQLYVDAFPQDQHVL